MHRPPPPAQPRSPDTIGHTSRHFPKHASASPHPRSFGFVKATYADAIEFTAYPPQHHGLLVTVGLFGSGICALFGWWAIDALLDPAQAHGVDPWLVLPFALFSLGAICLLLFVARQEWFRPEDQPTLFDRRHRKVHRLTRRVPDGLSGLFRPWPLRCISHDWDGLDATHLSALVIVGSTVTRQHHLIFQAQGPGQLGTHTPTSLTPTDEFTVGHHLVLRHAHVAPLWEHIRRFMDEEGPHLSPGDALADPRRPRSWWQSLQAILPNQDDKVLTRVLVALAPLSVPVYLIWGTANWLGHRTARPVRWPTAIEAAVGAPLAPHPG